MDSFNPFANAWGDDTVSTSQHDPSLPSSSTFKFPSEDNTTSTASSRTADDPLGFGNSTSTPAVVVDDHDDGDAWGAPVASTSTSTGLGAIDEWSTAPSTPKPPVTSETDDEPSSWQPAGLSPALSSSPPAWAVEDDELREKPSYSAQDHQDDDGYDRKRSSEEQEEKEEEEGGFGGFAEALPDLGRARTPPTRQDSDTDWGATDLPPSKWDEHINAPPAWQPSSSEVEEAEEHGDGTDDPWRPPETRIQNPKRESTSSRKSRDSSDTRRIITTEAELDIEKLQSELGIQIRNLDEEYAEKQSKSPITSEKSPTLSPNLGGNKATSTTSRWSIWGAKKATTTSTSNEEDGSGSGSRRGSVDAKNASAISPRSSTSTAGIGSAASSPAPQTPDVNSDSKTHSQGGTGGNATQEAQVGVARFFKFGKGRANSADPSSITSAINSNDKKQTANAGAVEKKEIEITDDFSQLENFDSKRSTSANGMHPTMNNSGYDDFGGRRNSKENDDEPQRKRWFWRNNRDRVVDYSIEQDEEQDLDKVFSAFSDAPPPSSSTSQSQSQNTSTVHRVPSLRSQGRSSSTTGRHGNGITQDPFAHLSAAASSIRSSASIDPFDPLDPLAELNQASNITSRTYRDRPSPSISSRVPALSPPTLPPPPPSGGAGFSRPSSAVARPASNPAFASHSTPPPLLAPPPPLSSIANRKTPQPSLLDDLADLNLSSDVSMHMTQSPASGNGPVVPQAPSAIRPLAAAATISNTATSKSILDDDFGDFETFTNTTTGASQHLHADSDSPKKAAGPMKLASKQSTLPPFVQAGLVDQNANNKKNDLDFFDSL